MVCVKIQGGLGNQLFTYAHGYAASKIKNEELIIDISDYSNGYFRNYQLDKFMLEDHLIKDYHYPNNKIGRFLTRGYLNFKYDYVKEADCFSYQSINYQNLDKLYLYGYWQNENYFKEFSDIIRKQFQLKIKSKNVIDFNGSKKENSISVHIRRGDYLNNDWSIDINYYFKAIHYIENMIDQPEFYFFSDDMEWVKSTFENKANYHYVSFINDSDGLDDFTAMSDCEHNIIANSTFSWWAAWLNDNSNKIVIAPGYKKWSGDYYPKEWKQIPLS